MDTEYEDDKTVELQRAIDILENRIDQINSEAANLHGLVDVLITELHGYRYSIIVQETVVHAVEVANEIQNKIHSAGNQ